MDSRLGSDLPGFVLVVVAVIGTIAIVHVIVEEVIWLREGRNTPQIEKEVS